jgi:hypothetical protein
MKTPSTDNARHMLLKFLGGGAALGAGAASAVELANWLKTMHADSSQEQTSDDDTIYVNVPKKKAGLMDSGIAVTGGILSTAASAMLVRKLSQMLKKKQMQRRLDDAQQIYTGAIDRESEKVAEADGRPMSKGEGAWGAASAVPVLLAIASGALSYNALNKYFPEAAPTKNRSLKPRRIVMRYQDEEPLEEGVSKEASFDLTADDLEDSNAFLVRIAHGLVKESGVASDLGDFIGAVQAGRNDEICHLLNDGLDEAAFDAVKGASCEAPSIVDTVAYGALAKSARLGPLVELLAAAEIFEHIPRATVKFASNFTAAQSAAWAKIAATFERAFREDEIAAVGLQKSAADMGAMPPVQEADLLALLQQMQGGGMPDTMPASTEGQTPADHMAAGGSAGDPTTSLDGTPATPLTDGSTNQDVGGQESENGGVVQGNPSAGGDTPLVLPGTGALG